MSDRSVPPERPILFSAPMVRAILEGRKTQTRRVITRQPLRARDPDGEGFSLQDFSDDEARQFDHEHVRCPYGVPGDRLWVRETWGLPWHHSQVPYFYRATDEETVGSHPDFDRWRPSIFMPRAASRITLEITRVRVERVQDISEHDALAEGVTGYGWHDHPSLGICTDDGELPSEEFRALWDSINATRGFGWNATPLVWVIEFRRLEPSS